MANVALPRAEEFQGTSRFLVLRRIGTGGAGVVYEAYDREQGARVALKTLRKLLPDALLRFKNEFRQLQDIHHPNLVGLGELFEEAGQWFFTMELVEGKDLVAYVGRGEARRAFEATNERTIDNPTLLDSLLDPRVLDAQAHSPHDAKHDARTSDLGFTSSTPPPDSSRVAPFDERRLRRVIKQLARGVAALHASGKVHRDIKATNVLVTAEGRLVLLDFGLVMEATRAREEAETNMVVGTEKYMAPEQAAGGVVGKPADCYSIGVALYRALTGQFPFGSATDDLLLAKQRMKFPEPAELIDGVAPDLNALCMDLLKVVPSERPTCEQILERLNAKGTPDEAMTMPSPFGGPFVGRDLELAILREAFDDTLKGGSVAVAMGGDSGVGKSTLARRFAELVREECGAMVLAGRCYERESVPYKALDGLIDSLTGFLSRAAPPDIAPLVPKRAHLLAQAFPVLRKVPAFAKAQVPAEDPVDPLERRAHLFGAVRELFTRLGERVPLVLLLDDLQWSDADSLVMLREILRGPGAPALLLLATMRATKEGSAPEHVTATLGDHARSLRIERLPMIDARALAKMLLDSVPWSDDAMADAIAREAAGHPLFIDELVRHSLAAGAERAKSPRLDDALWARVSRLDPKLRDVIEAVAVAAGPVRHDVAAHATRMDLAQLTRAVARLRVANLVRSTGLRRIDAVEPYHDKVRYAVMAHVDDEAARTWHRRIAAAMEATGHIDADALVTHWRAAGDTARAQQYALLAAAQASDVLAFDRAARLYKVALEIHPAADARAIRVNLGFALANAGRGAEAAEAYLAAVADAEAGEAVELQRRAAEQLLLSGHLDEGLAVLQTVLAAMGMEVPRSKRGALASLLVRRSQLRLRGLDFEEREEAQVDPDDLRRIDLLGSISASLAMIDTLRGTDFQTRHVILALKAGEPVRAACALALEAGYSATGGSRTAARTAAIVARANEIANRVRHPRALGWAAGAAGAAAFLEGRWRDAFELFTRTAQILRAHCSGVQWEIDSAHFYQLAALVQLGQLRELGRRIPALLDEAEQRGDRYVMTHLRTGVLSMAWLARGDAAGARREADEAIARWSQRGIHLPHFLDVLGQGQIDLYEGNGRAAWARVTERWEALSNAMLLRVQFIRIKLFELRARAALASARSDGDGDASAMLDEADRCARAIDREETAWGAPFARMIRAGVAVRRGDTASAVALLEGAEVDFSRAQMDLHAAVARYRRGSLIGGDAGAEAVAAAESWLRTQEIQDIPRMVAVVAP